MVLYGPPGTGKTTLARLAAEHASAAFEELSAVNAGRAEVREVIARATERNGRPHGRATIFFLDEIHRFNKAQQDALLPAVEEGLVTLIGATTENPYFEVNSALLSRAQVYELRALEASDLEALLRRALERGAGEGIDVPDEVITFLAARAGGDARTALNALELAVTTAQRAQEPRVTLGDAEDALQRKAVLYDKAGDQHYDYISAWIKSTRGSDPDASLYYLAAMVEGGEDPRFIARRMIVLASEDIGNADPQALPLAVAAAHAVEHVGFPEAEFALAQAAIYLSLAPKSDAVKRAMGEVHGYIREHGAKPPPAALRSAAYPAARKLGRGKGYDYPHGHPGHVNDQDHLPEGLEELRFYFPDEGEPEARDRLAEIRKARGRRNNGREAPVLDGMRLLLIALFATLLLAAPASAARFQHNGPDVDYTVAATDTTNFTVTGHKLGDPVQQTYTPGPGQTRFTIGAGCSVFITTGIAGCFIGPDATLRLTTNDNADVIDASGTATPFPANSREVFDTKGGDDVLKAGPLDDTVDAGAGDDTITGGAGADVLRGAAGDDSFTGLSAGDVVDGGAGADRLDLSGETAGLSISLDGVADDGPLGAGANVVAVETVIATPSADLLTGGEAPETLGGRRQATTGSTCAAAARTSSTAGRATRTASRPTRRIRSRAARRSSCRRAGGGAADGGGAGGTAPVGGGGAARSGRASSARRPPVARPAAAPAPHAWPPG